VREVPSQRGAKLREGRRPRRDFPEEGDGGVRRPVFYTIFISALVILFALHVGLELYGRLRRRKEDAPGGKEGPS